MPNKIQPTAVQKRNFLLHAVIFLIASILMLTMYNRGATSWVYPWPAWPVAAWALALLGHWTAVYRSYEDRHHDEFDRQVNNG